jgi:hypothetical protein
MAFKCWQGTGQDREHAGKEKGQSPQKIQNSQARSLLNNFEAEHS